MVTIAIGLMGKGRGEMTTDSGVLAAKEMKLRQSELGFLGHLG